MLTGVLLVNKEWFLIAYLPTLPKDIPSDIVRTLDESTPEQLQIIARYAEALTDHKKREARLENNSRVQ